MDNTVNIAHVGYSGGNNDRMRALEAIRFTVEFYDKLIMGNRKAVHENFNICHSYARQDIQWKDWLALDTKHDIVILHFLAKPCLGGDQDSGDLSVSPLHSWSNWRKRLNQCGAKLIFPFGGELEVSGAFVAPMDGFRLFRKRGEHLPFHMDTFRFWVFVDDSLPVPDDRYEMLGKYFPRGTSTNAKKSKTSGIPDHQIQPDRRRNQQVPSGMRPHSDSQSQCR